MWFLEKKKEYLLQWQKAVICNSPDKLVMTEQQLIAVSNQQAANDLRIINDCTEIIGNTTKPDVFFSRLNLLKEKGKHLVSLERYIKFSGASPTAAYNEIIEKEQEAIYLFIIRYFNLVFEKAEAMKTDRGRKAQYQKFFNSLQPYFTLMDERNKNYINNKVNGRM